MPSPVFITSLALLFLLTAKEFKSFTFSEIVSLLDIPILRPKYPSIPYKSIEIIAPT